MNDTSFKLIFETGNLEHASPAALLNSVTIDAQHVQYLIVYVEERAWREGMDILGLGLGGGCKLDDWGEGREDEEGKRGVLGERRKEGGVGRGGRKKG